MVPCRCRPWCPVGAGHGVLSVPAISQITPIKKRLPIRRRFLIEASRPPFGGPDSDGVSFELFPQRPRAAAAALSPQESVSRNFQSPMAPYKFRSLATPERGRKG